MPIRFLCTGCNRMLSIGRRKAGTSIDCPKCGYTQTVPGFEAAAASLAAARVTATHEETAPDSESADAPCVVIGPPLGAPSVSRAERAAEIRVSASPGAPPGEWIILPRQTLYIQGLILAVVALGGVGAGYLIGRGGVSPQQSIVSRQSSAVEQVLVEGRLLYDTGSQLVGDRDAVMLLLPQAMRPDVRFTAQPFRPHDPPPDPSDATWRRFSELGGVLARADQEGKFTVVVPQPGRYWMLLISRHTDRAETDRIEDVDRDRVEKYFVSADEIIGRRKYRWTLEQFTAGVKPVEHNFGIDGQDELSEIL
ncbi:MAG: hypothetical protein KJZ87_19935 [Thermoguttaceae bacterium]|nr:hypothetical protein [Thermoguttaceae bacterium]